VAQHPLGRLYPCSQNAIAAWIQVQIEARGLSSDSIASQAKRAQLRVLLATLCNCGTNFNELYVAGITEAEIDAIYAPTSGARMLGSTGTSTSTWQPRTPGVAGATVVTYDDGVGVLGAGLTYLNISLSVPLGMNASFMAESFAAMFQADTGSLSPLAVALADNGFPGTMTLRDAPTISVVSSATTTAVPTPDATPALSSAQIGGIVAGLFALVAILGLVAYRRRRSRIIVKTGVGSSSGNADNAPHRTAWDAQQEDPQQRASATPPPKPITKLPENRRASTEVMWLPGSTTEQRRASVPRRLSDVASGIDQAPFAVPIVDAAAVRPRKTSLPPLPVPGLLEDGGFLVGARRSSAVALDTVHLNFDALPKPRRGSVMVTTDDLDDGVFTARALQERAPVSTIPTAAEDVAPPRTSPVDVTANDDSLDVDGGTF
jgi:hypothetical protein